MSSYPTGGPGLYYGADPQQGVHHDPPQFDPYNTRFAHDAYEHGEGEYREPYKDEPIASYSLPQGQSMEPLEPTTKEEISYYAEETNATPRKPRSARNLRAWRYQQGRRLWTQGSRPRCICRFFFCTILITLFLVAGIVLCLALWIQPPNIVIGGDNNNTSPVIAQGINLLTDGFQVNLGLPIEVVNPNYFSVNLKRVDANIFYPINNTRVGTGVVSNVNLQRHASTSFTFPFALVYTTSVDPSDAIITDIAGKCLASPQRDLTVNYRITVDVKVFFITISPTISNAITFACPLSADYIRALIQQLGLQSILGTGSS